VEEDAVAFLTGAALVGRYSMSQQERWPANNTGNELEHKSGECIGWLVILADTMDIDIEEATTKFLTRTEKLLK